MKKSTKNFILAAVIVCLVLGAGFYYFLMWNSVEHLCATECTRAGVDFVTYKESDSYNFIQCLCRSEDLSAKKFYFDLDTKERISSSEVLQRVLG